MEKYTTIAYQMIIPIMLGWIINKLDNLEELSRQSAIIAAQHEVRITALERHHPIPAIYFERPKHLKPNETSQKEHSGRGYE